MITTLNAIRQHVPCADGWEKLLRHLGKTKADDEPLRIVEILDSNGLEDALWCLRAVEGCDREIRLYAVWCARQAQHLIFDPRCVAALDVAERYANGQAANEELEAAQQAVAVAWSEAKTRAEAASAVAAWAAALDTASAAARDAALAATQFFGAEEAEAARDAQSQRLREACAAAIRARGES